MYPITPPSQHFAWAEAEVTNHREFDNTVPTTLFPVIRNTAEGMERVRAILDSTPILVTSWYRSPKVNIAVGSSNLTSQHPKGEAVDFIAPRFGSPKTVCEQLVDQVQFVNFDQLILEHTWIHISFTTPNVRPRKQVLSLLTNRRYALGLTDKHGRVFA